MGYGSYHGVPPPVHAKWNMRVSVPVFLLGSLLIQVTLLRELGGVHFIAKGLALLEVLEVLKFTMKMG